MRLIKRNSMFPGLFDDFFPESAFPKRMHNSMLNSSVPAINIKENETAYELQIAAPGVKKEDFNISVKDNLLQISVEHKEEKKEENENYTRREFGYFSFQRSFTLPEDETDIEKIEAKYEDGVLKLMIPKKEMSTKLEKMRTIEIG